MNEGASPPRRLRATGLALAALWVLLIGLAAYAAFAARGYFEVDVARTPDLQGLPLAEATRLVEEQGLNLRTYPTSVAGAAAEAVTEQAPPAGAVVRHGRTISVGVNVPAEADRMPSLVGVREEEASRTLRDLGLAAPAVSHVHSDRPAGEVVDQAPAAGSEMAPDDPVRLTVSRGQGAERVELPDLVGLDLEAARTQLTVLGVRRVEAVPVDLSSLRAGAVVQQDPAPGTEIAASRPVSLGYALPADRVVRVPDLYGMSPERARAALLAAGLAVGPVEVVQREDAPEGVVEARPSGATAVGSPISLVVNADAGTVVDLRPEAAPSGPGRDTSFGGDRSGDERFADPRDPARDDRDDEARIVEGGDEDAAADADDEGVVGDLGPGGRVVPFRFDPNTLGVRSLVESEYDLRLVVADARGERTAIDETIPAGESVEADVKIYGDEPLLQTYVNGVFFQAWRP